MKRLHGRDVNDLGLFHVVVDSTALPVEDVVQLLATAALCYWAQPASP
jgi:cytidylate kinase